MHGHIYLEILNKRQHNLQQKQNTCYVPTQSGVRMSMTTHNSTQNQTHNNSLTKNYDHCESHTIVLGKILRVELQLIFWYRKKQQKINSESDNVKPMQISKQSRLLRNKTKTESYEVMPMFGTVLYAHTNRSIFD